MEYVYFKEIIDDLSDEIDYLKLKLYLIRNEKK